MNNWCVLYQICVWSCFASAIVQLASCQHLKLLHQEEIVWVCGLLASGVYLQFSVIVSYPRFSHNGHTPHCYWTSSQEARRPAHLWYLSWLLHWTQTAAVFPRVLQTVSGATCGMWSPGAIPSLPQLPSLHPPPTNWCFRSANCVLSQQSLWGPRHPRESQRATENPVWEV